MSSALDVGYGSGLRHCRRRIVYPGPWVNPVKCRGPAGWIANVIRLAVDEVCLDVSVEGDWTRRLVFASWVKTCIAR